MKYSSKHQADTIEIKRRHIGPFLLFNISIYILSAICFMIYTTQQSYTYAEGDSSSNSSTEDLGYDLSSVDASVTVGTACTFTGTVTSPHTATIANGINSTDIGTTVLNTKCNDSGGYALYAIGYTNDEYGVTDLSYTSLDTTTTNPSYNIPTGTNTTGSTSNWSMKLSQVPGTTPATIENGYSNYNIVPDDYTKVATLNTVTDPSSTSTPTGSSVSTTYQTYISPTQPAGTYTGKVKYTLVHPSTAPAPEKPKTIDDLTYMQDFKNLSEENKVTVLASMPEGQQYILKDSRDQKDYYISKLADGNIWMTQNLDLCIGCENTADLTSRNTDLNEFGAGAYSDGYSYEDEVVFWSPAFTAITSNHIINGTTVDSAFPTQGPGFNVPASAEAGSIYVYASGSDAYDIEYDSLASCIAAGHHTDDCTHYHVGNYYNWSAAIASNNSDSISTQYRVAANSICPAGWRLPKSLSDSFSTATTREFGQLFYKSGVTSSLTADSYAMDGFYKLRAAPLYFVLEGYIYGGALNIRTSHGYYLSSTVSSGWKAYEATFLNPNVPSVARYISSASTDGDRYYGRSVRCIVR